MSNKRQEVKNALHEELAIQLDPLMNDHGFKRIKKSSIYRRKTEYGVQTLVIYQELEASRYARLAPEVVIQSPIIHETIAKIFKEQVSQYYWLMNANNEICRRPILFLMPKSENKRDPNFFRVNAAADMRRVVKLLFEAIDKRILPYINACQTFETIENIVSPQKGKIIFYSIIGSICNKKYDDALSMLELLQKIMTNSKSEDFSIPAIVEKFQNLHPNFEINFQRWNAAIKEDLPNDYAEIVKNYIVSISR